MAYLRAVLWGLIYMNSLPAQVTNGLLLQYADDATIICTGATPNDVQKYLMLFALKFY